jgi:hypothetical protein
VIDRVGFRAVYERFPAAIKGAFVLRGADGMPHQVRIQTAWVRDCGMGRQGERLNVEPTTLEVAPTLDTFVPFEIPILDLDPGWYELEVDAAVDGIEGVVTPGERFTIGWPRGAVRKGTVDVGKPVGETKVRSVEFAGDSIRIVYEADEAPALRLTIDGAAHPVVAVEHDEEAGSGRVVAYPALRDQGVLAIAAKGADPVEIHLP